MKRMGMVIGIRPERIAEYKRTHAAVWPEVLAKISDCNISNYTIFLREPENLLFGYFEYHGDDWAADAAKMAADPRTQDWWAIHKPMQAPLETRKQGRLVGDGRGGVPPRLSERVRMTLRSGLAPPGLAGAVAPAADRHDRRGLDRRRRAFPRLREGRLSDRRRLRSRRGAGEGVADKFGVARSSARSTRRWRRKARSSISRRRPPRIASVLERVPVGSHVLIQKPMGADLDEATAILEVCRERKLDRRGQFPASLRADDAGGQGRARPRAPRAPGRRRGPSRDRHALGVCSPSSRA